MTVNALTVSDPLTIRSPSGTGTVTVNGPITGLGNGSVTLTGGTGATPITLNGGITTAGNTITLNDNVGLGANVTLDSTNGGGAPAGANISISGTVDGAQTLIVTAGTGNVDVQGAIGTTTPLSGLTARGNRISLQDVTTSGTITLTSRADLIINSLTSTAAGIDLTSRAGSILDGNGAANNLTAAVDSTLRALGGVIGLITDPIEVTINPGMLGVAARGQIAGVSVNIDGTVLPSKTLTLLNSPPGLVIFNGRIIGGGNVGDFTRATSDLDPQRVNEDGFFTDLLLDTVDDTDFAPKPENCEVAENLQTEGVAGCYQEPPE